MTSERFGASVTSSASMVGKQGVAAPVSAMPSMPAAFMLYTPALCYMAPATHLSFMLRSWMHAGMDGVQGSTTLL